MSQTRIPVSSTNIANTSFLRTYNLIPQSSEIKIPVTTISDKIKASGSAKNLRKFNFFMGILHLVQGLIMLNLSKSFKLPITTSYLHPDIIAKVQKPLIEQLTQIQLGPVIASFLLISAVAHFVLTLPGIYEWYIFNLRRKVNFARWYEYALSSSVMIVVIALLCGMFDFGSLILIFTVNASMNLFGLVMEQTNAKITELDPMAKTNWTAYILGCCVGIIPWIVLALYFFSAISNAGSVVKVPDFVYGIFYSLFVFFNIFALNMFLQYKKVGPWKNYIFGEKVYIVLSLVAKSFLAWQVFGGTLR